MQNDGTSGRVSASRVQQLQWHEGQQPRPVSSLTQRKKNCAREGGTQTEEGQRAGTENREGDRAGLGGTMQPPRRASQARQEARHGRCGSRRWGAHRRGNDEGAEEEQVLDGVQEQHGPLEPENVGAELAHARAAAHVPAQRAQRVQDRLPWEPAGAAWGSPISARAPGGAGLPSRWLHLVPRPRPAHHTTPDDDKQLHVEDQQNQGGQAQENGGRPAQRSRDQHKHDHGEPARRGSGTLPAGHAGRACVHAPRRRHCSCAAGQAGRRAGPACGCVASHSPRRGPLHGPPHLLGHPHNVRKVCRQEIAGRSRRAGVGGEMEWPTVPRS